jgi:L-ascorbate metabolism protein UlaG (beta-lactamase superfamily)
MRSVNKALGAAARGARLERIQGSPRFRDGRFHNVYPILPGLRSGAPMPSLWEFLRGGTRRTPEHALPLVDPRPLWSRAPETGMRCTWLGHSTLLVELDGVRVLTDPVWGTRASPISFIGPKRFHAVPVELEQLPELDAIIISHDHYDHLDYPTVRRFIGSNVPFVTSLGVGAHLAAWGIDESRIVELDWWESTSIAGGRAEVTAAPSQHFSGRGLGTRNQTAWSSFAVRGERHGFFFSGDTGLTPEYASIRQRLGRFDIVALEVGAFHPAWGDIHLGPWNAMEAFKLLGGAKLLPVHWGTFNLALHAWDEPAEVLLREAASVPLLMPKLGEAIEPSRAGEPQAWWRQSRPALPEQGLSVARTEP